MLDEAVGTFLLVSVVATVCMTWFGSYYLTRMTIIASTIRAICIHFTTAGPSLNPMLGTTWAFYSQGSWPANIEHYLVYWAAPYVGAAAAVCLFTIIWAVVSGPQLSKSDLIRMTYDKMYTTITKVNCTSLSLTHSLPIYSSLPIYLSLSTYLLSFDNSYHQQEGSSDEDILSFFSHDAQLVLCSGGACTVIKRSEDAFLNHFRSMKHAAKNIPSTVVDESANSVFLKWIQEAKAGTDTVIFDNQSLKIVRVHTTVFM